MNLPEAMPIKEALTIYDSVVCELLRLEQHGKDDHRDSWMGNAIKAVRRLEEHHRKHLPQIQPEGDFPMSRREEALAEALQLVLDDWANSNVILEDAMDRAHAALAIPSASELNNVGDQAGPATGGSSPGDPTPTQSATAATERENKLIAALDKIQAMEWAAGSARDGAAKASQMWEIADIASAEYYDSLHSSDSPVKP